jgi:hypothetical protein
VLLDLFVLAVLLILTVISLAYVFGLGRLT